MDRFRRLRNKEINSTIADFFNEKLDKDKISLEEINISLLKENPYQPRIEIKQKEIKELADSIQKQGLIQPIVVTKINDGYFIIAGHRRVEAFRLLNRDKIKAFVLKASDDNLASIALIENLQRKDLDIIEVAIALKRYKEKFNKTLEEISKEIGKNIVYVSRMLGILELPDKILEDIKLNKSTKDITALNLLNRYAKNFRMRKKENGIDNLEQELFELYKSFLKNGREWLRKEIKKRMEIEKDKDSSIKVKFNRHNKITIEIRGKINEKNRELFIKELENLIMKYKI